MSWTRHHTGKLNKLIEYIINKEVNTSGVTINRILD